MLVLLPVIFQAHKATMLMFSFCVTFVCLIASAIIANATADILLIFACVCAFAILIYNHERNMMSMFLVIQGQQIFYDQLLSVERSKLTAEIEKDELRALIGSVAHDLKTPLQAFMVEMDGLQTECEAVQKQLLGLTLLHLPAVTTHANIIAERTEEAQKYLLSLRDIYQFMVMAINRAIEFRKNAAGLALMPTNETFHLSKAIDWGVARFANNPSGVEIRVENFLNTTECCPYLIADKHWLTENVMTLLSNACKFTTKGEIVLRICIVRNVDPAIGCKTTYVRSCEAAADSSFSSCITKDAPVAASVVSFESGDLLYERVSPEWMADHPEEEYFVHIEVEDCGIGVGKDQAQNLFQPFGLCQRRAGGVGLGLFSLAKRMEVIRGRCGMHDRPNGMSGCCFWFSIPYIPDANAWHEGGATTAPSDQGEKSTLPTGDEVTPLTKESLLEMSQLPMPKESSVLTKESSLKRVTYAPVDAPPPPDKAEKEEDVTSTKKRVVLLVDDSMLILKTTGRMLAREGFEVQTAQNGEDALLLMQRNSYFFVLSDIQMPVMDGLEMTQRVRQSEEISCVKAAPHYIIGMSANSDAQTRDDALACGMNSFIPKPVRTLELWKHIPAHLEDF